MSAREFAVTRVSGAAGFCGADDVAGSMLGAFLWACTDTPEAFNDVCEVEESKGDINGEMVGGCRGLLTSSLGDAK